MHHLNFVADAIIPQLNSDLIDMADRGGTKIDKQRRVNLDDPAQQVRRERLHDLIKTRGGPAALALKLQLSGPSYLSQLLSGTRPFTEKTARQYETKLGMKPGWFDSSPASVVSGDFPTAVSSASSDVDLVVNVTLAIQEALAAEGIKITDSMSVSRSRLIEDALEHARIAGKLEPGYLQRLVKLLK